MSELITLGETMVAFTPSAKGALRYIPSFSARIAGAESNVAIGLSKLGHSASWISRLGKDEFGQLILNATRAEGVDCSSVVYDKNHRSGVMFKEMGAHETKVYYYRENSAASHMCPEDLNETDFKNAKIVHLTGITPVLSKSCEQTVQKAIELVKKHQLKLSFDPNIRKKLWRDKNFEPLIREITLASDVILLGLDEAEVLFQTKDSDKIFDILLNNNPNAFIAIKDGARGSKVANSKTRKELPPHPCRRVEPIGAGDAYSAGFLAGVLEEKDIVTCGQMGNIAGALATETEGDIEGYPSREKMEIELNGSAEIFR